MQLSTTFPFEHHVGAHHTCTSMQQQTSTVGDVIAAQCTLHCAYSAKHCAYRAKHCTQTC